MCVQDFKIELGGVYKLHLQDEVGGQKMSPFCQRLYHRKCQHRGLGGLEKLKFYQRKDCFETNLYKLPSF